MTTQTTSRPAATLATPHRPGRMAMVGRVAFGAMFAGGSAVHVTIVVTGTEIYRHFADTAPVPFVKQAWLSVFMPHAALFGRKTTLGLVAAIAFLGLMLFGWGFWFWSIPILAMLVALLRYDFGNAMGPRRYRQTGTRV